MIWYFVRNRQVEQSQWPMLEAEDFSSPLTEAEDFSSPLTEAEDVLCPVTYVCESYALRLEQGEPTYAL
jgi:hypothetical protein